MAVVSWKCPDSADVMRRRMLGCKKEKRRWRTLKRKRGGAGRGVGQMLLCLKTVVQLRTEEQKPDPFSPFDQLSERQAGGLDLSICLSVSY